jgi:hypothetical protein
LISAPIRLVCNIIHLWRLEKIVCVGNIREMEILAWFRTGR